MPPTLALARTLRVRQSSPNSYLPEDAQAFGDCLALLLRDHSVGAVRPADRWSAARLARALGGTTPTLVRRWLRHECVPAQSSDYVARIAACLQLSPGERADLECAQIESLRALANLGRTQRRARRNVASGAPPPPTIEIAFPRSTLDVHVGPRAVLEAAIRLLESAPPPPEPGGSRVMLTARGEQAVFMAHAGLWAQFLRAQDRLLTLGWNVQHLWRLEHHRPRVLSPIERVLATLELPGSYEPRAFARRSSGSPPSGHLIVPGHGGLFLLASQQDRYVDTALSIAPGAALTALEAHYDQLLDRTIPIVEKLGSPSREPFEEALTRSAEEPGDRFAVGLETSVLASPLPPTAAPSSAPWAHPDASAHSSTQHLRRRAEALREHVHAGAFRDIIPKSAIRQWVTVDLPRRTERLRRLEQLARLLREQSHYELALLDTLADPLAAQASWCVHGDHSAYLRPYATASGDTRLLVREPLTVQGFRDRFDELWTAIPAANRDRDAVLG